LACGGTHLNANASSITAETVWNDGAQGGAGGGGVSAVFARPAWQEGLSATLTSGKKATALARRGVPDVAGDASPTTGYEVLIGGSTTVVGGTSAVAPLWAGLIARINAASGGTPVGFLNAKLYRAQMVCNDITQGNNGSFEATAGWDACTGLGSPDGAKIAAALKQSN
jgi:kumamolisin